MRLAPSIGSVLCLLAIPLHAQDWPQWRGPAGDNHAVDGATAPVEWSETENLAWLTPIPGRGHSSPTIVGGRIYLTTSDAAKQTQTLLVIDKESGKIVRESPAHQGGLPGSIHANNTHASPTVASDGERVYALFYNADAMWVTAYDLEGERLWQKRVAGFDPQMFQFGFGPSPRIVGDLLIVCGEYDGPDSGIYALDPKTGEQAWKAPRPSGISFSSPIDAELGGKQQLLMSGNGLVASYDPATGKELWKAQASTQATCGTMVWDPASGLAFASGGFPDSFTLGIQYGGDHQVVWKNTVKLYEQSALVVGDFLYGVGDNGVAYCWRCSDGKEQWKQRLGGSYSASPLLVGDTVYVSNEQGTTFVFKANPAAYEQLAKNQLGDDCFPTTTPSGGRLYHRYGKDVNGGRQEYLAAIGG